MTKNNRMFRLLTLCLFTFLSSPLYAQTCAGVEFRVNTRTGVLGTIVGNSINAADATIFAFELKERALLLSAMKVNTAQSSAGSDQRTLATKQTNEATASTLVTQSQNFQVADAKHKYQSTGYDPCGVLEKASDLHEAVQNGDAKKKTIRQNIIGAPENNGRVSDWIQEIKKSTIDPNSLYNGNTDDAARYINAIIGMPEEEDKTDQNTAVADTHAVGRAQRNAYKSLTSNVLSDIAAENGTDGSYTNLRKLTEHWIGSDGGETWAAGLAAQHERGIILDMIRIEAANVGTLALQIKKNARTEASAAALLLATVDSKIQGNRGEKE
jgi:hypothetical protein